MNPPDLKSTTAPQESPEITTFGTALEALLRNPAALLLASKKRPQLLIPFISVVVICVAIFGFVLGSYSGGAQFWAAPLKTLCGLLITAAICFPSFYIFSCLANAPLGLRELSAVYLCFLALLTLLLVAFAPILWIFTQSSGSLSFVGMLSIGIWLLSFAVASGLLRKASQQRRSWQAHLWLLIFLAVSLQMTTALRPFLGTAPHHLPQEKRFFIAHWAETIGTELSGDDVRDAEAQSPSR